MPKKVLLDSLSYSDFVSRDSLLNKVFEFLKGREPKVYLVGGYLRDKLLNRVGLSFLPTSSLPAAQLSSPKSGEAGSQGASLPTELVGQDIDFVLKGDPIAWAKDLSTILGGSFFILDKQRRIARVVAREQGILRTVDFSPLKGSISENLRARDFTIDALAIDLFKLFSQGSIKIPQNLIDIVSGWRHLSQGKICAVSKEVFLDDPLRLLRAVCLAFELDFEIDRDTQRLIRKQAPLLAKVAGERILDELLAMFSLSSSYKLIKLCDLLGLSDVLFPELATLKGVEQNGYHHLDVWEHTIFTLERLEEIIANNYVYFSDGESEIKSYLSQPVQKPYTKLCGLKLAALLHDIGKPRVRTVDQDGNVHFFRHSHAGLDLIGNICQRLKMGNKLSKSIVILVREHMRPGFLAKEREPSTRAIYRFFRNCGGETPGVLMLSLADRQAALGVLSTEDQLKQQMEGVQNLMKLYLEHKLDADKVPRLISGYEIMKVFNLNPGPLIGKLLELVEQARFEGKIKSKREALNFVRKNLRK